MKIDYDEVNERLIKNEKYAHRKLAPKINKILAIEEIPLPYIPSADSGWLVNGEKIIGSLTNFVGVIDLETTGLSPKDSTVICAVGLGWIDELPVVVSHGKCQRLPIEHSCIANINQPFDRSFYQFDGGNDTNLHIDLSSLAKMVVASPDERSPFRKYVSLKSIYQHYFDVEIDKGVREKIVDGSATNDEIFHYCWEDIIHTVRVAKRIIPDYVEKNPSPISMLAYSLRFFNIPFSDRFQGYYDRVANWFEEQQKELYRQAEICAINSLTSDSPSHLCFFEQFPEAYKTVRGALNEINAHPDSPLKEALLEGIARGNQRAFNIKLISLLSKVSFKASWMALLVGSRYLDQPLLFNRKLKEWRYGDYKLKNLSEPRSKLLTPFTKDYYEDENFTSDSDVVGILKSISMWIGFESRMKVFGVDNGWHVPQYTPVGTLTGRSTDDYFLLCPKPKKGVGGSEFLSFIEAKPGYKLVTADFDSQELVLAAHMANHWVGATNQLQTEFAQMIFEGDSDKGTDVHSMMAAKIGILRKLMKNKIYGANYGEGKNARIDSFMSILSITRKEAIEVNRRFEEAYLQGTAKPFFDSLIRQAELRLPTCLLLSELPDGLLKTSSDDYVTTRRNRVIQALGSDQTNVLTVDMDRQIWERGIDATLTLIRHDEVIYHVAEKDIEEFKVIIQEAHRFSVELILARLGIEEAVERWLYFSSVDVLDRYVDGSISPTA